MRRIRDIPRFNPEQKIGIISEKEQISGEGSAVAAGGKRRLKIPETRRSYRN